MPFHFDNTYARLPERFYARVRPTPVKAPRRLAANEALAEHLRLPLNELMTPEMLAIFAGNSLPDGAEPIATAYAGHQFGQPVPQLGDGRAILLGEVVARDGLGYELQLKGAGPTPFSRRGDGRAAIGPVLREYLVSEAMAALGVATTRSLYAAATGEPVYRQDILPGAVLTRVARSHLRVGTFEYFAIRGDTEGLVQLTQYALARLYPGWQPDGSAALHLLESVVSAQAELIAHWLAIGFVHGVMNTDNTAISGETIDYGPCAFLDAYVADRCFSSIDTKGRYAYNQQPACALWNLTRLAEALYPVVIAEGRSEDQAAADLQAILKGFAQQFDAAYQRHFGRKLGLDRQRPGDSELIASFLKLMATDRVDFTLAFHGLTAVAGGKDSKSLASLFSTCQADLELWLKAWEQRCQQEEHELETRCALMNRANPVYIPRNHLIEKAIAEAIHNDLTLFNRLHRTLAQPYTEQPGCDDLMQAPGVEQWDYRTFCGT